MKRNDANFGLTGGLFQNEAATLEIESGLSCIHLQTLKDDEMISSYEMLYKFYVACKRRGSGIRKVIDCVCHGCEKAPSQQSKSSAELFELFQSGNLQLPDQKLFRMNVIHACLSCVYFGCFKDKCHIKKHSKKKNHPFAMDIDFGQVYCFECGDYKYDIDFIKIAEKLNAKRRKSSFKSQVKPIVGNVDRWEPSPELIDILQYHDVVYNSEIGIRGLFNIGKYTCYLNVIIQSLIHAPVFRDYLLSLQHKCKIKVGKEPNLCLICPMTNVVQESFSGKLGPFAIANVLCRFFQRCHQYARQPLQDAHECYLELIVNFHQDETGEICSRDFQLSLEMLPECSCVIHEIFGFILQKEKRCQHCEYFSSEEVELHSFISLKKVEADDATLYECMESFWKEEIDCHKCKTPSGCTVQSKPISLPYILNICSNQFDFKKNRSTYLKYEEFLDLSPYILPSWKSKKDSLPEHAYYLFGVVEYVEGSAEGGHYKCYIKKNSVSNECQWFECNDKETCPISIEEVLEINVRLLFYHKMFM